MFSYPSRPGHGEGRRGRGQADGCDLLAAPPRPSPLSLIHTIVFVSCPSSGGGKNAAAEINVALSP